MKIMPHDELTNPWKQKHTNIIYQIPSEQKVHRYLHHIKAERSTPIINAARAEHLCTCIGAGFMFYFVFFTYFFVQFEKIGRHLYKKYKDMQKIQKN